MLPTPIITSFLNTKYYSLFIQQEESQTKITMKLFIPILNTEELPYVNSLLEKRIPSIMRSKCFNDKDLPFSKEVKQTEIGHLFEHILLEFLCKQKKSEGYRNSIYNGVTNWNWEEDEKGVFHIVIDTGLNFGENLFLQALEKSSNLMILLFDNNTKQIEKRLPA